MACNNLFTAFNKFNRHHYCILLLLCGVQLSLLTYECMSYVMWCINRCPEGFVGLTTMGQHMTPLRLQTLICRSFHEASSNAVDSPVGCRAEGWRSLGSCEQTGSMTPRVTVELMVHPGYRCPELSSGGCGVGADDFAMSSDREHEMFVLCGDEMIEFYKQQGINLISW